MNHRKILFLFYESEALVCFEVIVHCLLVNFVFLGVGI
jgi:hypothetical protein